MRKTLNYLNLTIACALAASALAGITASAQTAITSFVPGDIVVERVGDGTAAVPSTGAAIFLDEYTPAGTLVGTYALPSSGTTPIVEGSAGSDGLLSTSADGQFLVVPGYDTVPGGTTSLANSTSAAVPREVATVSASGALVQTTINNFSGNNFRAVASPDGTTIYATGGTTGILSVTSGATNTAGTVINNTNTNYTAVAIFNGQLYAASAKATTFRLGTIGTGIPTTTGQTATNLPGITTTNVVAPTAFVAATLTLGSTTTDTFYVADSGAINKFTLSGGTYTLNGSVALTGVFGLTGTTLANGTEQLYATTASGLYSLADAAGSGALTGTPAQIAAAATNELLRGVTFAPSVIAVPEPSTGMLSGACGLVACLLAQRSRRRSA